MRNATALCGHLFGVTGIVGISDVCRALVESRSNPAFPAHARPCRAFRVKGPALLRRPRTADICECAAGMALLVPMINLYGAIGTFAHQHSWPWILLPP